MFYGLWKDLIIQSAVGWLLPLEHLWVQASSHRGVAHIIYVSLKQTVRHHWFLSKPGVSMMQAHGWGKWWTCHPSGAVRSCQRTGSRPLARRGQASQLSPLWHWLRPSIWLSEAHHGWRGTCQNADMKAGMHTLQQPYFISTRTNIYMRKWCRRTPSPCLQYCTPRLFWVITSTIWGAVHMNHSPTDRSGKQKWHAAIKLNRHK